MLCFRRQVLLFALGLGVVVPDASAQWVETLHREIRAFFVSDTTLFAGVDFPQGLWSSKDHGGTWSQVTGGGAADSIVITCSAMGNGRIFAGTETDGLAYSTDDGKHWVAAESGQGLRYITALAVIGDSVYVGTNEGVRLYTGGGTVRGPLLLGWQDDPFTPDKVNDLIVFGSRLYVATWHRGVLSSTDRGRTWAPMNTGIPSRPTRSIPPMMCFAICRDRLYLGTNYEGVLVLTADGTNNPIWSPVSTGDYHQQIQDLAVSDSILFVADHWQDVSYTTNGGSTWYGIPHGLSTGYATYLIVDGGYLLVGKLPDGAAWHFGIWRQPLTSISTSVQEWQSIVPVSIVLEQNYPNPFNPWTTIRYALPQRSHVTLAVFNVLGQHVATLVNGEVEAGYHEVQFSAKGGSASGGNAAKIASGVYFYRLTAGAFVQTKRLLLLR